MDQTSLVGSRSRRTSLRVEILVVKMLPKESWRYVQIEADPVKHTPINFPCPLVVDQHETCRDRGRHVEDWIRCNILSLLERTLFAVGNPQRGLVFRAWRVMGEAMRQKLKRRASLGEADNEVRIGSIPRLLISLNFIHFSRFG